MYNGLYQLYPLHISWLLCWIQIDRCSCKSQVDTYYFVVPSKCFFILDYILDCPALIWSNKSQYELRKRKKVQGKIFVFTSVQTCVVLINWCLIFWRLLLSSESWDRSGGRVADCDWGRNEGKKMFLKERTFKVKFYNSKQPLN